MTHIGNVPGILERGCILPDGEVHREGAAAVVIGHASIKARRLTRTVPCPPGGCLGDYVPFYFAPRSPMLFAIHKAVEGYDGGQDPVVYVVSTSERVVAARVPFAFTNGHAAMQVTDYFNDVDQLTEIDWKLMGTRYWYDTDDDPDRKRRRQAEFLVKGHFRWPLVDRIVVRTDPVAERLRGALAAANATTAVEIRPKWYY